METSKCECGMPVTSGYNAEVFCANPTCTDFLRDVRTGAVVKDHRYEVALLDDDDPKKLQALKQLLRSEDYMERIAAVKQLERMLTDPAIEMLVDYLRKWTVSSGASDSVAPLVLSALVTKRDIRVKPGLEAAIGAWRSGALPRSATQQVERAEQTLRALNAPPATLLEAVVVGDGAEVARRIAAGERVDSAGQGGATPLHMAAYHRRRTIADALLAAGAIVDCIDGYGNTPAWLAVNNGYPDILERLLAAGANPNGEHASRGVRLLHLAVVRRLETAVVLLLQAGADRNAVDKNGKRPIDYANELGYPSISQQLASAR